MIEDMFSDTVGNINLGARIDRIRSIVGVWRRSSCSAALDPALRGQANAIDNRKL